MGLKLLFVLTCSAGARCRRTRRRCGRRAARRLRGARAGRRVRPGILCAAFHVGSVDVGPRFEHALAVGGAAGGPGVDGRGGVVLAAPAARGGDPRRRATHQATGTSTISRASSSRMRSSL
jgi:hypothetical protein